MTILICRICEKEYNLVHAHCVLKTNSPIYTDIDKPILKIWQNEESMALRKRPARKRLTYSEAHDILENERGERLVPISSYPQMGIA